MPNRLARRKGWLGGSDAFRIGLLQVQQEPEFRQARSGHPNDGDGSSRQVLRGKNRGSRRCGEGGSRWGDASLSVAPERANCNDEKSFGMAAWYLVA